MRTRQVFSYFAAVLYVLVGTLHFVKPEPYLKIMPPWIPWPEVAVMVSGVAEVIGGIGMAIPKFRRAAAWWLVALLVAVFPANVHMAMHPVEAGAGAIQPLFLWMRLPVQALLIWWVLWCSRPNGSAHSSGR